MKPNEIKSLEQAEYYCEGLVNDLQEGLISKSDAMKDLASYTAVIAEKSREREKKEIDLTRLLILAVQDFTRETNPIRRCASYHYFENKFLKNK